MSEREDGFYWVREIDIEEWIVAFWGEDPLELGPRGLGWWLPACNVAYKDKDLAEIDERRIVRDEPEGAE